LVLVVGGWWWVGRARLSRQKVTAEDQQVVVEEKEVVAVLQVIEGQVELERKGKKQELSVLTESELYGGELIDTKEDSIAVVKYDGEIVVRLAENTRVTLQAGSDGVGSLVEEVGSIYVRFKKVLGVGEEFRVDTPTAVATVRGTAFLVEVGPAGSTEVVVVENQVLVAQRDHVGTVLDSTTQMVEPGFQAKVEKLSSGEEIDPETVVGVVEQSLTVRQEKWLEFNQKADELLEQLEAAGQEPFQALSELATSFKPYELPTPTPTPVVTPTLIPTPAPTSPPVSYLDQMLGGGYNTGVVRTEVGNFPLSCYGAAQGSVRVVTDSANDDDCKNDCPVLPLHEYAVRNGGVAALNGMYFCPVDYAECQDKKNTFDTLLFNSRVKRYINSDNNVYSVLPFLVILADGSPRFVSRTLEWGRDTGVQAGTAGNPMLVQGGNMVAQDASLDYKQREVKSNRGAFVQKGGMMYLCIVGRATVIDSAHVYKSLGVDNAINIDGGGSSALWVQGSYRYGPGRQIPSAIIFALR
jgi:hypothetical protein